MQKNEPVSILLVDDHDENLIALEAILARDDYNLVKCTSGKQALKLLLEHEFAVVLLDVMMPDIDGFELATLLRRRRKTRYTPIIFLTAIAKDAKYVTRGYDVGAVDYISKPLEPAIVSAKVQVFVELFRLNRQLAQQAVLLRESEAREKELQILKIKEISDRRYRKLAESIPQIVWRASVRGEIEYFGPQWREFDATPEVEIESSHEGWSFYRFAFHPEDFLRFSEIWEQSLISGEAFECQCRLKKLNTYNYRWYLCRAVPERDADGNIIAWLGTWTDIHTQKEAEERESFLAQAGKTLASSLDYMTILKSVAKLLVPKIADWCVIDVKDMLGKFRRLKVVHADPSCQHLTNVMKSIPIDDVLGGDGGYLVFDSGAPVLLPHVTADILNDLAPTPEYLALLQQLGIRSLISAPIAVRGQVIGAMTLVSSNVNQSFEDSDVNLVVELSRHVALAIDNARLYKIAQDSNRLKDEFLATVSHELRTPLSAVLGWADLLLENQYDEDTSHCLETIRRNAKSLAILVEDLLDVSRIISGKILLNIQKTELAPLIRAAVDSVLPAANSKEITLTCDVAPDLVEMMVDPARLQQIAWNLVSNAIKFTPRGGHVEVSLHKDQDNHVVLSVRDDGVGLQADFIPRIFERFIQVDGTTTREYGGLGLGLAIVRHLVELHGGQVMAESDGPNLGSTFTVTIPYRPNREAGEKVISSADSANMEQADKRLPSLNGLMVLVVDDQEDSRTLIGAVLNRHGATVNKAESVKEAIDLCRSRRPDVILSDIGMPHQDGYDLLHEVRRIEEEEGFAHVPMAAITAHVGRSSRNKVIAAGFDAYLAKPVKFNELVKSVATLAGHGTGSEGIEYH